MSISYLINTFLYLFTRCNLTVLYLDTEVHFVIKRSRSKSMLCEHFGIISGLTLLHAQETSRGDKKNVFLIFKQSDVKDNPFSHYDANLTSHLSPQTRQSLCYPETV